MVIASSISFHCSHRAIYTLVELVYMIIAAIVRIDRRIEWVYCATTGIVVLF